MPAFGPQTAASIEKFHEENTPKGLGLGPDAYYLLNNSNH
jgi:hypothetical protein